VEEEAQQQQREGSDRDKSLANKRETQAGNEGTIRDTNEVKRAHADKKKRPNKTGPRTLSTQEIEGYEAPKGT